MQMADDYGTLAAIERRRVAMMDSARPLPPPDALSEVRRLSAENGVLREERDALRRHVVRLQRENEELRASGAYTSGKIQTAEILRVVSVVTGVEPGQIKGPTRTERITMPRHFAWHLFKIIRPDMSQPSVGLFFGGRDHTTVRHGLKKVKDALEAGQQPYVGWFDDWRVRDLIAQAARLNKGAAA